MNKIGTRRRGAAERAHGPRVSASPHEACLFIFARTPVAGAVKKRLARDIGGVAAAAWYRGSLAKTMRTAKAAGIPFRISVPTVLRGALLQPHGDLGGKMGGVAKRCAGPCIIVGSDIPGLTPRILRYAVKMAPRFDLVIGPARDGGYYLVGVKSPSHVFRLYDRVRWSSAHALADTLKNAPKHWRIGYLPMLRDVDTADDLPGQAH